MSDDFKITRADDMRVTPVLFLSGRMDATAAQALREECAAILKDGRTRLAVNLENVSFVASSGLGTFLLINDEFAKQNGQFVLTCVGSTIMQVLELLNLDQFLEIRSGSEALFTQTV